MRSICISMLEFLQTIRFVQNFFAFLYKLTRKLSRRKETAKKAENFLGIWTANIRQCHDIRTPIDGIRDMVEISRHYAENAVDHPSAYEAGKWFIYMKTSDFYCAECRKNLR